MPPRVAAGPGLLTIERCFATTQSQHDPFTVPQPRPQPAGLPAPSCSHMWKQTPLCGSPNCVFKAETVFLTLHNVLVHIQCNKLISVSSQKMCLFLLGHNWLVCCYVIFQERFNWNESEYITSERCTLLRQSQECFTSERTPLLERVLLETVTHNNQRPGTRQEGRCVLGLARVGDNPVHRSRDVHVVSDFRWFGFQLLNFKVVQKWSSSVATGQSTLEQHGFDLHRSTYRQILFNKYNTWIFSSLWFS